MVVEHSDEGDEEDVEEQPHLQEVEARARSAEHDVTGATATPDDIRKQGEEATSHNVSETIHQLCVIAPASVSGNLSDAPSQPGLQQSLADHPILRLEALLGELDEDDTQEAQQVFKLVRRNLEKGSNASGLIDHLNRLFVPVKQRVTVERDRLSDDLAQVSQEMLCLEEKRDRLSNDMTQVEKEMQLFEDVDGAGDNMDVDG
jgi:hypothetical protein